MRSPKLRSTLSHFILTLCTTQLFESVCSGQTVPAPYPSINLTRYIVLLLRLVWTAQAMQQSIPIRSKILKMLLQPKLRSILSQIDHLTKSLAITISSQLKVHRNPILSDRPSKGPNVQLIFSKVDRPPLFRHSACF